MFHIDNIATTNALNKGHSTDLWATTEIRAGQVLTAGIGCSLFSVWERKRSSRATRIVDDLTQNLLTELEDSELTSFLDVGQVAFPAPILRWMDNPCTDLGLG